MLQKILLYQDLITSASHYQLLPVANSFLAVVSFYPLFGMPSIFFLRYTWSMVVYAKSERRWRLPFVSLHLQWRSASFNRCCRCSADLWCKCSAAA